MRRLLALPGTAALVAAMVVSVGVLSAGVASASPLSPPNERKPSTPPAADLGDAPWSSSAGTDMLGYRMSTYTGRWYAPSYEQFRLCVVQRESGGHYSVVSGSGYQGAYQFGSDWAPVIISRLTQEMVATYGASVKAELNRISGLPINRWPRFWQDAGFWVVFAKGSGASNWAGGNWNCSPTLARGWPSPNYPNYSPIERSKPGSGPGATPTGPAYTFGTPQYSERLAQQHIFTKYSWGKEQLAALKAMWWRESNWDYRAINQQGPWYGLGQVNGDFIAAQGVSIKSYMKSPYIQVKVGAAYIKSRYGKPTLAWAFWQKHGWY